MNPLISVIIPTYERKESLFEIVNKILLQKFQNWELIIIDDSLESINDNIEKYLDKRIVYIHHGKKLGVSYARNFGVNISKAEYIAFLDDDDDIDQAWLLDFANDIMQNNIDLLFCIMKMYNAATGKFDLVVPEIKFINSYHRINFLAGSFCIRKNLFLKIGGYDNNLFYAESTELFLRLEQFEYSSKVINSPNFIYLSSEDGGSKNLINKIKSLEYILLKHKIYFDSDILNKQVYLEILGVTSYRLSKKNDAIKYFYKAIKANIFSRRNIKNIFRIFRSLFKS